ncbi:MAG: BACON domain-containing protein [Bacteroidales bacterium]|nr:BACON domain-containing protein [Bacteroidales bacterium]
MKLRNIVASFLAVVAMSVSCVDELSGDLGSIKLDKSTIVMPEQGGSATITINAMTDWSVDAATVPEGVTVTPMSGKAGETKMTISTAGGSLNDIASDIVILVGKQKQFIKFYQPGDPSLKPQFDEFTAGDYWIMCQEAGEWFALKSTGCTIDDSGSYNYLYSVPAVVGENGTLSSTASNIFTFEAVEGGFIIKDPAGGYLYQVAKYNNFYLTSDKAQASVWAVNQISADEFMLEISDLSKWMQYSTSYDSAGAYATAQEGATLPKLVKAEEPAVEPFIIETTEFTLPIEAGELLIPVEYNGTDIHVGELPSWLKFYGYHDGSIKFEYEENTGGKREAKVILTTCMEDGNEFDVELTFTQTGSIQDMTVADFLAAEEGAALYKLTGKVANLKASEYGNFDLVDATGSVYVYGLTATPVEKNDKSFPTLGIKEGDIVTLIGTRASYNGAPQVGGPAYYVSHEGHTEVTNEEFLAKEVGDAWYKLTGRIANIVMDKDNPTIPSAYGNFDLVDENGTSVYVYGLTAAPVAKNDQSFPTLGLKEGDIVTLIGKRAEYKGSPQVGGPAYYISHEAGAAVEYSLDGKQWVAEMDGMQVLFDFGLAEEGMLAIALPTMDGTGFGLHMAGIYEIQKTDATSGVVSVLQYDWENDETYGEFEMPYSELGEASVKMACETVFGVSELVAFTAVENPYEIQVDGSGAAGEVPDGDYWFIEPTNQKVMTPLGETASYGRPSSADAINGASTAKNAFTLTYDPDWSCYTIQDSYGRYLYQGMQADGVTPYKTISLATSLPAADDENMAYYMWTVYNNGDGTYDVYNCASYYSITYSASYNNWEIYDPYEADFSNLFPSLVKADNPVEEPEPEESEVLTLTNAEICAALTSSSTSYATYTIESASGDWTVNASQLKSNTFLQCRGKKGGYIKTPEFDKDIKSVTIHFTTAKSVYSGNTYCVFPSTWTAPTADAAYPEDGNVGKAVTDGSYSLTIPVDAGNKQVYISIIGTYAYYLDHIDVAF